MKSISKKNPLANILIEQTPKLPGNVVAWFGKGRFSSRYADSEFFLDFIEN